MAALVPNIDDCYCPVFQRPCLQLLNGDNLSAIPTLIKSVAELQQQYQKYGDDIATLRQQNRFLLDDNDSLHKDTASLRNENASLRAELQHQSQKYDEEIATLHRQNSFLMDDNASLHKKNSSLHDEIANLTDVVRRQGERIAMWDSRDVCRRYRKTILHLLSPYVSDNVDDFSTDHDESLRDKWLRKQPARFLKTLKEHLTIGKMGSFIFERFNLDGARVIQLLEACDFIEEQGNYAAHELFRKLPVQQQQSSANGPTNVQPHPHSLRTYEDTPTEKLYKMLEYVTVCPEEQKEMVIFLDYFATLKQENNPAAI